MRRKKTIRIAMLAIILVGAFLVLRSAAPIGKNESCKESLEKCCKKKNAREADKTIWGGFSQHFSSI